MLSPENEKKLYGMIGLAARARRIITGVELINTDLRGKRTVKLVLVASDASENSKKRTVNCCRYYNTEYIENAVKKGDAAHAVGKPGEISAIAICDDGFASAIKKIILQ